MRDGPEGTKYEALPDGACRVVMPNGRVHKAYFDPKKSVEESILEMPGMPNWKEPDEPTPPRDLAAEVDALKAELASQKAEVSALKPRR